MGIMIEAAGARVLAELFREKRAGGASGTDPAPRETAPSEARGVLAGLDRAPWGRETLETKQERPISFLRRIGAAVRRIANESLRDCDRCGQDIPPDRLEAVLMNALCIDCQEEQALEVRRGSAIGRRTT
jgi:RNA polymerase-binding transcription factor DksA